ncbi:CYTH domain-containing protein [Prochlorococcus sp. MIT 1307]|uniref:CYTH domain-containing protein n=1 Tax=Prochlorococcus sp. MIT 1307 TaxID=3096219 RepID=UPI002A759B66|nr:CYTH domain-containing protein [Prochlorococcus sp. MIT 1307]
MALEIERRFLVKGQEWKTIARNAQHFRQGYLVTSVKSWTVRVRIIEQEKAWLTLKSPAGGIARHEFEYLIPLDDAESLWDQALYKLTKTRYELRLNGFDWVIDCFEDQNAPLVIAEVELTSHNQAIEKPNWCYQEVTALQKLSNAALAQDPVSNWSIENRLAINLN